ncbi:MAG: hypothetical protein V3U82_05700 [Robiginitomaculum sp.]
MRIFTLLALGVSTIALSGCSFINGITGGHGHNHHQASNTYGGTYNAGNDDCCVGQKALSTWNLEGGIGKDFTVGGDMFTGDQGHANILGQTLNSVNMNDAYDAGIRAAIGTSYALNPNRKITGQVVYNKAEGNTVTLGQQGLNALSGTFGDYESLGVEAGLRQYFTPRVVGSNFGFRPYVEGKMGVAKVKDIDLTHSQANVVGATTTEFYDGGWVPSVAGLVGVETIVAKRATIGLETGIRFSQGLDSADNLLTNSPQFGGTNNGGERWSVPVTLRGRYRF